MEGSVMHRAVVLVSVLALVVGACGGGENGEGAAADTSAAPTTEPDEAIVIRTRVVIAGAPGAEPIATGEVLEGSSLGGAPFCAGGTVLDSHGSTDPTVWLIRETITCPDGTLTLLVTPDEPQGLTQTGSWTVDNGTGAFEGLRGSGQMDVVYDPDPDSPADVTLTGTVTRQASLAQRTQVDPHVPTIRRP
jgi:hypothetical protein